MSGPIGRAAFLYFALVFAAGFALGTVRVLLIAPSWGELPAVLLEAPAMLVISWLACGWTLRRFAIRGLSAGLAVGTMAFALLMMAELALSLLLFGRSLDEFFRALVTAAGAVGLASQILFGLFPLARATEPVR